MERRVRESRSNPIQFNPVTVPMITDISMWAKNPAPLPLGDGEPHLVTTRRNQAGMSLRACGTTRERERKHS